MLANHQFAVIMFTDIVGYTAMMGSNEEATLKIVTFYEETVRRTCKDFNGNIINFYGDGCLVIFDNVPNALQCAITIQECFQEHIHVPLRIGVHQGDTIYQNGNVYGDAVNIASRIESLGQSGAVLLSEVVQHVIQDSTQFKSTLLGSYEFKNVDRPMNIYALTNGRLRVPKQETVTGKLKKKDKTNERSIAVLPFSNETSDASQQFFVDGLGDELRSLLLSVDGLKVIARSSSVAYQGKAYSMAQLAKELQVEYVLEGHVSQHENQLRLDIELNHTYSNKQIWAMPSIKVNLEDVHSVQSEIALSVASELRVMLSEDEKNKLAKVSTSNNDALVAYQKGLELLYRGYGKVQELSNAMDCFKKAIDLDPDFAKAYIGIADVYLEHLFWGRLPAVEVVENAKEAALKALKLDPSSGEVFGVLGAINIVQRGKREQAFADLNKAIELSPSYLGAYEKLAFIHTFNQNFEEAKRLFEIAQELDPLSTLHIGNMGHAYYYNDLFDEGMDYIRNKLVDFPNDPWLLWIYAYLLSGAGDYQGAVDVLSQRSTSGRKSNWMLGYNYGMLGKVEEARAVLDYHIQKSKLDFVPAYMVATIYMGLGDKEACMDWLEKDWEQGGLGLFFDGLRSDPKFVRLHGEARFQALLDQLE